MGDSRYRWAAIALGMGIALSPDGLGLLGNFMGNTGWVGLCLIPLTMLLFITLTLGPGPLAVIQKNERSPLTFLPLAVRGATALFLSTGILVSSGFVFNEVFLYWFPNFGFAFLLLIIVTGLHVSGGEKAVKAQILFTGLTLICLFVLILSGLSRSTSATASLPGAPMNAISLPLMLWVGVDLCYSPCRHNGKPTAIMVIIGLGGVFMLWGLVSIIHLPLEKLSSGVPQMKTASALLGQTGRYIMGAAVIMGTLSAVNALFLACRYTTGQLGDRGLLPFWVQKVFFTPLVISLGIGVMMAAGMAGSDTLEIWIQAALLLWLLTYTRPGRSPILFIPAVLLYAGGAWIIFSSDRPLLTILYMVTLLGAGLVPGLILNVISHTKKNQRSVL